MGYHCFQTMDLRIGHPDEWQYFYERCGDAVATMTHAHNSCIEFLDAAKPQNSGEHVLYLLGASCLKSLKKFCYWPAMAMGTVRTNCYEAFSNGSSRLHTLQSGKRKSNSLSTIRLSIGTNS